MDNRRLIIAVAVSFALLFGWTYFSEFMGWTPTTEELRQQAEAKKAQEAAQAAAKNQTPEAAQAPEGSPAAEGAPAFVPTPGQDVTVSTPLYTAVFNSSGGVLKSFTLNDYMETDTETLRPSDKHIELISPEAAREAPLGLVLNNRPSWFSGEGAAQWSYSGEAEIAVKDGEASLTFNGQLGGVNITRTFTFNPTSYVFSEKTELASNTPQLLDYAVTLGTASLSGATDYMKESASVRQQGGTFEKESSVKDLSAGLNLGSNVDWAGNMGTYFLAAVIPSDKSLNLKNIYENNTYKLILEKGKASMGGGQTIEINNSYYFGPKLSDNLKAAPVDLSEAMDYGWFWWIAPPLLTMLKWLYGFVGNWGLAIIALTCIIKLVLAPLSYKSYKSMDQMRKIQPLMQKIREKYKDDKQRQNQEVMQLYKTYKINPAGGCLPILVQLPIFIGLYRALLYSIELRQASFIPTLPFTDIAWLADLSLKDPLYITPLVMGATMFLQQKMTPTTGDPTQAKIMMFMPVIFTVMFVNFPSGLVVYWLINNVLSIIQQYFQLRSRKS